MFSAHNTIEKKLIAEKKEKNLEIPKYLDIRKHTTKMNYMSKNSKWKLENI